MYDATQAAREKYQSAVRSYMTCKVGDYRSRDRYHRLATASAKDLLRLMRLSADDGEQLLQQINAEVVRQLKDKT